MHTSLWKRLCSWWFLAPRYKSVGIYARGPKSNNGSPDVLQHLELDRHSWVLAELLNEGLIHSGAVIRSSAASFKSLALAHSLEHLESLMRIDTVERVFAASDSLPAPDVLIDAQREEVSGTIQAAKALLAKRHDIAFNLGGGFHHASRTRAGGFCLFNDIAAAIYTLRSEGFLGRCAIIDLDFHQPDGLLEYFAGDEKVEILSLQGSRFVDLECPNAIQLDLPIACQDSEYLGKLRAGLDSFISRGPFDIVFYLAGADILEFDRLGYFRITLQGALARDIEVANFAQKNGGAPVLVLSAGGYSKDAWRVTSNFLRYCLSGRTKVRQSSTARLERNFHQLSRQLDPAVLQSDVEDLDFADIEQELLGPPKRHLLLDYYSRSGFDFVLHRFGIYRQLEDRGFADIELEVSLNDPARQSVRIHAHRLGNRHLLCEVVVRRQWLNHITTDGDSYEFLVLGWLLLQDPSRHFSRRRAPLVGQSYPGLGLAQQVLSLLKAASRRLGLAGILFRPAHFHSALFQKNDFMFLNPQHQANFENLRQLQLQQNSSLQEFEAKPEVQKRWTPEDYIWARHPELKAYFSSPSYRDVFAQSLLTQKPKI